MHACVDRAKMSQKDLRKHTLDGEKILSKHLKLAEKHRMSGEKLVKGLIFLFKGLGCPGLLACL